MFPAAVPAGLRRAYRSDKIRSVGWNSPTEKCIEMNSTFYRQESLNTPLKRCIRQAIQFVKKWTPLQSISFKHDHCECADDCWWNKDQTNLAKGDIDLLSYSPGRSTRRVLCQRSDQQGWVTFWTKLGRKGLTDVSQILKQSGIEIGLSYAEEIVQMSFAAWAQCTNVTDRQTDRPWNGNVDRNRQNRLRATSPKSFPKFILLKFKFLQDIS